MKKDHRPVPHINGAEATTVGVRLVAIATSRLRRHFLRNLLELRLTDFFGANPARQVQKRRLSGIVAHSGAIVLYGVRRKYGGAKGEEEVQPWF